MGLVCLSEFFDLPGAFGDESHDRRDLPTLAYERIRKQLVIIAVLPCQGHGLKRFLFQSFEGEGVCRPAG